MFKSPAQMQGDPARSPYQVSGAIPVPRGAHRISLKWLEHPWNFTVNDEGEKRGDSYWYSLAGLIQQGPLQRVRRIWTGGKPVYGEFATTADVTAINHAWGDYGIRFRVLRGTDTQAVDPRLNGISGGQINGADGSKFTCNAAPNLHPLYRGCAYIVFDTFATHWGSNAGAGGTSVPNIEIETLTLNEVINPGGYDSWSSPRYGVNPLGFFFDMFRSDRYGLGLSDERVPESEWSAAAESYFEERGWTGYFSPILASRSDAESLLQDLMPYVRSWLPRSARKILPRWMSYSVVSVGSLPVIDGSSDVLAAPECEENDPKEVYSALTVKSTDIDQDLGDASITIRSPYQHLLTEESDVVSQDMPHFHDVGQAKEWAEREMDMRAYPLWSAVVKVPRAVARASDGSPLRAGDLVVYQDPVSEIDYVCRVKKRKETRGKGVTLTLIEEPSAGAPQQTSEVDPPTEPEDYTAGDIEHVRAWLLPEALRSGGSPELSVLLDQPDYATSAEVWISGTGDFAGEEQQLGDISQWAAAGAVLADIDNSETEITFTPGAASELLSRSFSSAEQADGYVIMLIGDEVLILGALIDIDTGAWTYGIVRGAYGTTAAAHSAADPIWIIQRGNLTHYTHALLSGSAWVNIIAVNANGSGTPSGAVTVS